MNKYRYRVIQQKIVAPNGRAIAKATSKVEAGDDSHTQIKQNISVKVTPTSSFSSSSSSSCSSSYSAR